MNFTYKKEIIFFVTLFLFVSPFCFSQREKDKKNINGEAIILQQKAQKAALRAWCDDNGIELADS